MKRLKGKKTKEHPIKVSSFKEKKDGSMKPRIKTEINEKGPNAQGKLIIVNFFNKKVIL